MIEPNPKTNSLQQSVTKIQREKIPKIFSRVMTMLYHNLTELENPKTDDEAAAIKKGPKSTKHRKCIYWEFLFDDFFTTQNQDWIRIIKFMQMKVTRTCMHWKLWSGIGAFLTPKKGALMRIYIFKKN